MKRPFLLPLTLSLAITPLGAAQVYKWVDADGVVHFGDLPQHREAQRLNVKPIPASATPPPPAADTEADSDGAKQSAGGKGADQKSGESPETAVYCQRSREDLKRYEAAEQLSREDEAGNPVILDDKEREALLQRVRKQVEKWCK